MEDLIEIGNYVYHNKYGYGKVIGWDGTNIVNFQESQHSCHDKDLIRVSLVNVPYEAFQEIRSKE